LRIEEPVLATEVIDIRRFDPGDFAPLFQAEAQAWNHQLRWDHAPAARVISNCLADRRLVGYALVNEGRIEGYSFFLCEDEKGLVGDFFLAPAFRHHAVSLLNHVLETLTATPGVRRVEAQLPHFSAEELEPCFHEYGFTSYMRRFMSLGLGAPRQPAVPAAFVIEPWERRHDHLAAEFIYRTYRGHIDAVINDQYASSEGADRLIDNIFDLRGCGEPVSQASLVAVHRATQRLAGLVALTTVRPGTAHIPQVAVASEFQSGGLGTALLDLAFREAANRGHREVTLTVTDLNQGARRLYERMGFETFSTFGAFVWSK
jgi:ribosomal protein S18 acetylase RimI-like enzyme